MPKGYWIPHLDVSDPQGFQAYRMAADAWHEHNGSRLLARACRHELVEGKLRARNVLREFPSFEAALAAYDSPETIQYLPAVGATIGLAPFAIAAWETPATALQWTVLCLMGVLGASGHYLLALAHRYAPATVIAPFLYQQVFYMAAFGYLVFGDVPAPAVWVGAAIVVTSGLYLFARERARL